MSSQPNSHADANWPMQLAEDVASDCDEPPDVSAEGTSGNLACRHASSARHLSAPQSRRGGFHAWTMLMSEQLAKHLELNRGFRFPAEMILWNPLHPFDSCVGNSVVGDKFAFSSARNLQPFEKFPRHFNASISLEGSC